MFDGTLSATLCLMYPQEICCFHSTVILLVVRSLDKPNELSFTVDITFFFIDYFKIFGLLDCGS